MQNNDEATVGDGTPRTRPPWLNSQRALPFHSLSGDQFEVFNYLLIIKEHPGDQVIYYGKTRDLGRDIVRRLSDASHEIIQCKRYAKDVTVPQVREELAKLCVNTFEKRLPVGPYRVVFHVVPDLNAAAIDFISSKDRWLKECDAALKQYLRRKPARELVDFAKNWWPEPSHVDQLKLTERARRFQDLVDEFFETRQIVDGSLNEIKPKLNSIGETVHRILGRIPDQLKEQIAAVDKKLEATSRRHQFWFLAIALLVIVTLGAIGRGLWVQRQESLKADADRKAAQTIQHIQQEFAERFLQRLLADNKISAEDARQRALTDLPAIVNLPLAEIQSLIDRKIASRATEKSLSALERARAALAKGNYDEVIQAADDEKQQGRELAMLEGTAALAKFRQSPKPEWNLRALAAFQRAMTHADPTSPLEWQAWTDAAVSASAVLHDRARYAEAEPLLRQCQQIREARIGPDDPGLAVVLNCLAMLLQATNRLAEAEPLYRRALSIAEKSFGPDHAAVAIHLNNLGRLLQQTNRGSEAEPLYRRALAIDEKSHGPECPDIAIRLNSLALLLAATNRLAAAEPLYRRALAIAEQSYGPDHPEVATCLNNLAGLLRTTNRLTEAVPLFRRALAITEQSYGPDHPEVATCLSNLAFSFGATNRLAEPLYRRALAIDERSHGPDHPGVAIDLNSLALLLKATNRLAEAEPLYRRALAIAEQSYGPRHPSVAIDLNNLAGLLQATNRLAEAEPLYRRALMIDEKSYGPDHPKVGIRLNNLGALLKVTNRLTEAEPLYRRALSIAEKSYGPDHPDVALRLNNLAELLRATNRLAEAEPLYRRALAIAEQSYGPDHPEVGRYLNNLALLLQATNRRSQAEPLFAHAVGILARFERATGHEHPSLRTICENWRRLLAELEIAEREIDKRMNVIRAGTDKLFPIFPEVERLLGAAKPVADVLAALDRHYKEQGKPTVYFLKPDEPIAPHLDDLLRPSADGLKAEGLHAFRNGAHAQAIVLYDAALEVMARQPALAPAKLQTRVNRAAALRELGLITEAREELVELLPHLDQLPTPEAAQKGRARYHLALCQLRLGDRDAAQRLADASLAIYNTSPKGNAVSPDLRRQSEQLLADIKAGKAPPPLAKIDAPAAIEAARARYRACEELTKLPLNQLAAPLLDHVLGPARPTQEVFNALDRYYRDQKKPPVWFLPLKEPIAPHLDQLIGPAKPVKKVLEALDRQCREQGKPAVWFLPLNEPISPHLDELLGKTSK